MLRAGIKGEQESAYFLGFHFKDTKNSVLIHDLRLEHNGRVAQIDHLLLTRMLDFWILETKHFSSGLKIDEHDQFLRWNSWQKCYEGMPSPLEQAERPPAPSTALLGRDDTLRAAMAHVQGGARLMTVTGYGGTERQASQLPQLESSLKVS
jgi:hypothetical protein